MNKVRLEAQDSATLDRLTRGIQVLSQIRTNLVFFGSW